MARLIRALPLFIRPVVIVPADGGGATAGDLDVRPFRYAPRRWEILAHKPGGIPAALREQVFAWFLLPGFLLAMLFAVLRVPADTRVLHANWAISGCIAGIVGWLRRIPVVTTIRGEDFNRAGGSVVSRLLLWGAVKSSARVVCVSHAMREALQARYPGMAGRFLTIENGVADAFVEAGLHRTARDSDPLHLVTVGSLIPRKAHETLLKAFAVASGATRLTLTIIGDGAMRGSLEAMTEELGLSQAVRLAGALPPSAVAQALSDADIFVFPSRAEGRSNALLEALAAGLPVVASDIEGNRELVDASGAGVLVPVDDVTGFASAIVALAADRRQRGCMSRAAVAFIDEGGLNWSAAAGKYAALFSTLAAGK